MNASLLVVWMLIAGFATLGVGLYRCRVARKLDVPAGAGVAVVIPVKGSAGQEAALRRFLASCRAQRGIGYRLIFAVENEADPAAAPIAALDDPRVTLVLAGRATRRGQKLHNQLAALATLTPADRFVVFADADVVLAPDWLGQLLRPLLLGRADLASGYRWILPADGRLASRCCALMDWSVATAPRANRWNLCWGGSIAISRAALDRIDLPGCWDRAVLDDIVLTRAARRAGIVPHAPHHTLVPSPVRHDFRSLFEFGRRQYLLVRVHAPWHWALAGVTLGLPVAAGIAALIAGLRGDRLAWACLVLALVLQQVRASLRVAVARRVLPAEQAAQSAALIRRDRWLLPFSHLLHLAVWLVSGVGREMVWGGRRYRLLGPARVEIVDDAWAS